MSKNRNNTNVGAIAARASDSTRSSLALSNATGASTGCTGYAHGRDMSGHAPHGHAATTFENRDRWKFPVEGGFVIEWDLDNDGRTMHVFEFQDEADLISLMEIRDDNGNWRQDKDDERAATM